MTYSRTTSSPRIMGKMGFIHVFENGKFRQLSSNKDLPTWESFLSLRQGDLITYSGESFTTKTGESTIRVYKLEIHQKCGTGLPDKSKGVSLEISRKSRHLSLLAEIISKDKKTPYRDSILLRAKLLSNLRQFLDNNLYTEVQTPVLLDSAIGATATPFETTSGEYLRIAPEIELKKFIVGGFDRIYEIGKSFRNEGLSQRHNPEFTMLEFYTAGHNFIDAMQFTKSLLNEVMNWREFVTISYANFEGEETITTPTFVLGFPEEDSPLAKSVDGVAERWALYAHGMEIANGYTELGDWEQQLKNFEAQGVVDEDFINALKCGLPPCAGVGIGIDRLIMLLTGRNIKEII